MNMKKSLAVLAAATVAVSAMATTLVSAADASSYTATYSLVKEEFANTAGSATVSAHFDAVPVDAIRFPASLTRDGQGGHYVVKFVGTFGSTGSSIPVDVTYTTDNTSANHDPELIFAFEDCPDTNGDGNNDEHVGWKPRFTELYDNTAAQEFNGVMTVTYNHNYNGADDYNAGTIGGALNSWTIQVDCDQDAGAVPTVADYDVTAGDRIINLLATNITGRNWGASQGLYPYQTNINGGVNDDWTVNNVQPNPMAGGLGDLFDYLEGRDNPTPTAAANTWGSQGLGNNNFYMNVEAHINDVMANYNDVKLTFKTATQKVWLENDQGVESPADGNYNKYSDAWHATDYTKFNQGTYNLFGRENTGFVGLPQYDWSGSTLHSAALIVNNQQTMAYSSVLPFEYNGTELTFDLSAIVNESGYGTSYYTGYIQSLQLATTDRWFWDSMTITAANTEASDVGVGAGADEADQELEDTVEDIITEAPITEAPVTEAPVVVTTAAPVVEATPDTGSAPIALAVIPVALAAAAIVIKKRK